eukprot:jgi/Mesen1/5741/ME000029S05053
MAVETDAMNALFFSFGMRHRRALRWWFGIGALLAALGMLASILVLLWDASRGLVPLAPPAGGGGGGGPSPAGTQQQRILTPVVPGVNLPLSHMGYLFVGTAVGMAAHEAGHALAAASEGVRTQKVALFAALFFPGAYVALCGEALDALPPLRALRIFCAGVWHNCVVCAGCQVVLVLLPLLLLPLYSRGSGLTVTGVPATSPFHLHLRAGDVITALDDRRICSGQDWVAALTELQQPHISTRAPLLVTAGSPEGGGKDSSLVTRNDEDSSHGLGGSGRPGEQHAMLPGGNATEALPRRLPAGSATRQVGAGGPLWPDVRGYCVGSAEVADAEESAERRLQEAEAGKGRAAEGLAGRGANEGPGGRQGGFFDDGRRQRGDAARGRWQRKSEHTHVHARSLQEENDGNLQQLPGREGQAAGRESSGGMGSTLSGATARKSCANGELLFRVVAPGGEEEEEDGEEEATQGQGGQVRGRAQGGLGRGAGGLSWGGQGRGVGKGGGLFCMRPRHVLLLQGRGGSSRCGAGWGQAHNASSWGVGAARAAGACAGKNEVCVVADLPPGVLLVKLAFSYSSPARQRPPLLLPPGTSSPPPGSSGTADAASEDDPFLVYVGDVATLGASLELSEYRARPLPLVGKSFGASNLLQWVFLLDGEAIVRAALVLALPRATARVRGTVATGVLSCGTAAPAGAAVGILAGIGHRAS